MYSRRLINCLGGLNTGLNTTTNSVGNITTTGGNVGIGTNTPSSLLHVNGTLTTSTITTGNIATNNATISNLIISGAFSAGSAVATLGTLITTNASATNLTFTTVSAGSATATIGTLRSTNASATNLTFTTLSAGSATATIGSIVSTNVNSTNTTIVNLVTTAITAGAITVTGGGLSVTADSNTLGNIFTTGGNVGIGTTSPNVEFTVRQPGIVVSTPISTGLVEFRGSQTSTQAESILRLGRGHHGGFFYGSSAEFNVRRGYINGTDAGSALDVVLGAGQSDNPDTTVMTLLANGNVGIGTTSPNYKLDIVGDIRITSGSLLVSSISAGSAIATIGTVVATNASANNLTFTTLSAGSATATIGTLRSTNASATNLTFTTASAGSATATIGSIVSTNVNSTNTTVLNLVTTAITAGAITVTGGGLSATRDSNTLGNIFTTGGNVGIGTTTPYVKLHVEDGSIFIGDVGSGFSPTVPSGPSSITPANGYRLYFDNSYNGTPGTGVPANKIVIHNNNYTCGFGMEATGLAYHSGNAHNFYTGSNDTNVYGNNTMTINPSGVGIGISNPSAALDVAGDFKVSGSANIGTLTFTTVSAGSATATIGTLRSTNASATNLTFTTVSAGSAIATIGTLRSTNASATNLTFTTVSAGSATATIGTVVATNINSTNITAVNLVTTSITAGGVEIAGTFRSKSGNGVMSFDGTSRVATFNLQNTDSLAQTKILLYSDSKTYFQSLGDIIYAGIDSTSLRGLCIATSGNVGIGTIFPNVEFTVRQPGITLSSPISTGLVEFRGSQTSTVGESVLRLGRGSHPNFWGSSAEFNVRRGYTDGINAASGLDILLGAGGSDNPDTTVMTLLANGYIGINATSPAYNLEINGNCKVTNELYIGNPTGGSTIYMGGGSAGDPGYENSVIETRLYGSTESTELLLFKANDISGASGPDRIRLRAGQIAFDTYSSGTTNRTAESIRMVISNDGIVGIGTASPSNGKLEINGYVTKTLTARYYAYDGTNGQGTNVSRPLSIYASDHIACGELQVFSDERIKTNIIDMQDDSALNIIRNIQPKKYSYVDTVRNGIEPAYGFIAQQVEEVMDYSVSEVTRYIPNIFSKATVKKSNNITTLVFEDEITEKIEPMTIVKIKVYGNNDVESIVKLKNIIDKKTISIEEDLSEESVFVYGQEVDDFKTLNKSAIFTVSVAALQEVDRQLQTTKTELQTTKTELQTTKTELQTTKTELQTTKSELQTLKAFLQSKYPGEI